MKIQKISLADSNGGLNDRDLSSALDQNELSRLENYFTDGKGYLQKRPGKEIVQYAPINPQPFVSDGSTVALWHLDEEHPSFMDSGPNNFDLGLSGGNNIAVTGLFSNGQTFEPPTDDTNGAIINSNYDPGLLEGLTQVCFEAWCKIDASFSGRPQTIQRTGGPMTFSNDGSILVGTTNHKTTGPGLIINGLAMHRDWDPVAAKDSSSPYAKFTVCTNGVLGTVTELTTRSLPTGRWLHIRGEYDSISGIASLYVNGDLNSQATPNGGGTLSNIGVDQGIYATSATYTIGAVYNFTDDFSGLPVYNTFAGVIDEARISSVIRSSSVVDPFPFEEPRGMGFEFSKSDGTRQAVVSAKDKLWYTLGDGAWTQMMFFDGTVPVFSLTDYWDAIFRNDILYLANGVDNPLAWDGATLGYWMLPVNPPTLGLSALSGTITAGQRQVAYTYLYGSYETGLSPIATIDNPGGFQINVSAIDPRHADTTGVRIYMDKVGVPGTLYLVRQITHTPGIPMFISGAYTAGSPAGYSTDAGALGPADADLGSANYPLIESQVATAVGPNGRYLLVEHDRAFVCGMEDERYTLRYSELGALNVFIVFSFANAAGGQGNLIALASYYGEVHCSKDGRATLILRGSNPQNWRVLETLHPSVGAIDHWSYVHRYPFGEDDYVLCFAARDGFYKYAGQQIECISDKIKTTIGRLAQGNATRNEWDVTTTAQWQAQTVAAAGGSATVNIQAARYETDGLRQDGGTAKIVDQLDYLGLWSGGAPLVDGNVIAVIKGVAEGEFWFSTDNANVLWHTLDNFQTLDPGVPAGYAVGGADERVISITKRGSNDFYFLLTDTFNSGSSGGGFVYTYDNVSNVVTSLYAGRLFYDLDVPLYMSSPGGNPQRGRTIGHAKYQLAGSPNNIYINHQQNLATFCHVANFPFGNIPVQALYSNPDISSINTPPPLFQTNLNLGTNTRSTPVGPGFYSFECAQPFPLDNISPFDCDDLHVTYTRREFPLWLGGTFKPSAYWDNANGRLVFTASTAEDANGNRSTYLVTLDLAGVLTNQYTTDNVSAFATDGTTLWFYRMQLSPPGTFNGIVSRSSLATPGTIASNSGSFGTLIALNMSYNSAPGSILILHKYFPAPAQEFWTYRSGIQAISTTSLAVTVVNIGLSTNGDSGPVFVDSVVQSDIPFAWYVAVNKLSVADPAPIYTVSVTLVATVYEGSPYQSPTAFGPISGIISNLLFVPASGLAGGNLWADRLYWMGSAASNSDARFLQLGVPGNWTVIGIFESEAHNLGDFSAFDDLESNFNNHNNSNGLAYEVRNAIDAATLAASIYRPQQPNSKIVGYSPVQPYFQWRLTFTWVYTIGAIVTASPSADFVNIGFFLGQANLPRTVGFHWEGRTFWTCAEDGAAQNNVVLVYQKNSTWMKIYGWNLKSIFRFRSQMVALEAYQLERLMTGTTDAGAPINAIARTGAIMGFLDKLFSRLQANISAFQNNLFSSQPGYVKITPYQGSTAVPDGAWVIPVPLGTAGEPVRVLGVPNGEFTYNWIRALSLEVGTSQDSSGPWVPYMGQPEDIQQIDLELELTEDAYDIVVQ